MRVVLDTNLFVSSLLKRDSPPDLIRRAWEAKRFALVTSEWQLAELRRVSRYSHLQPLLKPHEIGRLVRRLRRHANVLTDLPTFDLSPDPDDNPLLATAVAGQADVLVTGDKADVLALGKVAGIPIMNAGDFLTRLR